MSSKPFLITGATGSIGRNVVEFLLERGHKVRAFVHKNNKQSSAADAGEQIDEQSSQLQQLGAEIAVGDLLDFTTLRPALDGISGAYFVYPIVPGIIDATAYFAQAAKEATVSIRHKSARDVKRKVTRRLITGWRSLICDRLFLPNGFFTTLKASKMVWYKCRLAKVSMRPSRLRIKLVSS